MQRESKNKIASKVSSSPNSLRLKQRRSPKTKEIDLDAEEEDKFGLSSTKNAHLNKNKNNKKQIPKKNQNKITKSK